MCVWGLGGGEEGVGKHGGAEGEEVVIAGVGAAVAGLHVSGLSYPSCLADSTMLTCLHIQEMSPTSSTQPG